MPEATNAICEHLGSIVDLGHPPQVFCDECLAGVEEGLTLRVCLTCGHVGCADGSASNHAGHHYAETDHAIAATVGSQTTQRWCYADARLV